jgi:hypothetical protein
MFKDIYLFTNGNVTVFDEAGKEVRGMGGTITKDVRDGILAGLSAVARITLARWKKGFFLLTREEFATVEFSNDVLFLKFRRGSADETDSAN